MLQFYEGHKVYMDGQYPAIWLNNKNTHIHRLEWIKYNGEIPKGYIVHHKDENKLNWSINNLELLKRSKHVLKHQHNLHNESTRRFGEESRHHKLSKKDVDYIRKYHVKYDKHFGGRALSKLFNVSESCISTIVSGGSWGDDLY